MEKNPSLTLKMKWLICLILMLGVWAARATDVFINLAELGANPATNRIVTWQQMTPFIGNLFYTNSGPTNGFWQSNVPPNILYNYVVKGPPAPIPFQIFVPSAGLGGLDMSNFTSAGSASTYPAGSVAPSWQAAWSLFALNGNVQSNLFYPLGSNPSNYIQLPAVSNVVAAMAQTNQYIPGANTTFTTNSGVVTISSTGAGAATNAITIQSGAGNNTTLTNSTLLGPVTSTNLAATYATPGYVQSYADTNGAAAAVAALLGSAAYSNASAFYLNYNPSNYQSGAQVAAAISSSNANYVLISLFTTVTNQIVTNGATNLLITSNVLAQATINGTNSVYTNLLAKLLATNSLILNTIIQSTQNVFVPLNAGPFYNTNTLTVTNAQYIIYTGNYYWNGAGQFTNGQPQPCIVSNTGTQWIAYNIANGPNLGYTNANGNGLPVGTYPENNVSIGSPPAYINYAFSYLQPANATLTNLTTLPSNVASLLITNVAPTNAAVPSVASGIAYIPTNSPSGSATNAISINNGSGTNTTIWQSLNLGGNSTFGLATNIIAIYGTSTNSGDYWWNGAGIFTNIDPGTGIILTNNGTVWLLQDANAVSLDSNTNLIGTNWVYIAGGAAPTKSSYSYGFSMTGSPFYGIIDSTNLNARLAAVLAAQLNLATASNSFIARSSGSGINLTITNQFTLINTNINSYSITSITVSGDTNSCYNGNYLYDGNLADITFGMLTNQCGNVMSVFPFSTNGTVGATSTNFQLGFSAIYVSNMNAIVPNIGTVLNGWYTNSVTNNAYLLSASGQPGIFWIYAPFANGVCQTIELVASNTAVVAAVNSLPITPPFYQASSYANGTQFGFNGAAYTFSTFGSVYCYNLTPNNFIPNQVNIFPSPTNGFDWGIYSPNNPTNYNLVDYNPNGGWGWIGQSNSVNLCPSLSLPLGATTVSFPPGVIPPYIPRGCYTFYSYVTQTTNITCASCTVNKMVPQ